MNATKMPSKKETLAHILTRPTPTVSIFLDNGATQRLVEGFTATDAPMLKTLFPPMLDYALAFIPYRGEAPFGTNARDITPSGELLRVRFSSKNRSLLFNPSLLAGPDLRIDRETCLGFLAWASVLHGTEEEVYAVHGSDETLGWITLHQEDIEPYIQRLKNHFAFDIEVYRARFDGTFVEMSIIPS